MGPGEKRWRRLDRRSHEAASEEIAGVRQRCIAIERQYHFKDGYDLVDALIGALLDFGREKMTSWGLRESLENHDRRWAKIQSQGSLHGAQLSEIIVMMQGGLRDFTALGNDKYARHRIVRAAREAARQDALTKQRRGMSRLGGRRPDYANHTLGRHLARIYFEGTGKLPASAQGRSGFRGVYMRFAKEALDACHLRIAERLIAGTAFEMRRYFQSRKDRRAAQSTEK